MYVSMKKIVRGIKFSCIFAVTLLYAVNCLGQSSTGTQVQVASGHLEMWVRDSQTGYAVRALLQVQGPRSLTLHTNSAGRVTLMIPAGEYAITVSAPGYKTMRLAQNVASVANQNNHVMLDPQEPPAEESPDVIRAHVRPGHTLLHGYVGDDELGKPISGATVQLGSAQSQTDARGHYFISIPTPPMGKSGPEPLTLTFQKPGYKTVVIENFSVSSEDMGKNMGMEAGQGKIRSVAPEGPGSGTAPMDPSQKGQVGISPELFRWAQETETAKSFAVVVPSTIMLGTGGPHNPTQAYEPCTRYACTNVFTFSLETYVTNGLPGEWLNWWDLNSQEAGAVAYRSYGAWFVANKACPYVGAHSGQCRVTYASAIQTPVGFITQRIRELREPVSRL